MKDLSKKTPSLTSTSKQLVLDLGVEVQKDIDGVEMGVLENGIGFLTQRGLASICGQNHKSINEISNEWVKRKDDDVLTKDRISFIKEYLFKRGYNEERLYVECSKDGKTAYAYPEVVCMAVLEYYAFEARGSQSVAVQNFRNLASFGFKKYIYESLDYKPNTEKLDSWRHFHDRVDLTLDSVQHGYFSVFREVSGMIVTLIKNDIIVDDKMIPDISVGISWGKHWKKNDLDAVYGERKNYEHNYPEYYAQSLSNPQPAKSYPDSALGEFRRWFREDYISSKFPKYMLSQVKKGKVKESLAIGVVEAVTPKRIES